MSTDFTEESIIDDIQDLLKNERIQSEPEMESFFKYFAVQESNQFLKNNEIFSLIKSHGINLINDVKYWLDRSEEEGICDDKTPVPVLDPGNFIIKDFNDVRKKLIEMPTEWTVVQITKKFSIHDITRKLEAKVPGIHIVRLACGKDAEKFPPFGVTIDQSSESVSDIFKTIKKLSKLRREYFTMGRTSRKLYQSYQKTNSELMGLIKELESFILREWMSLFQGTLEDSSLENDTLKKIQSYISGFIKKKKIKNKPNKNQMNAIYLATLSAHFLKNKDLLMLLKEMLYENEEGTVNMSELMLLAENLKLLNLSDGCAIKRAKHNPVILILDRDFESVPWEMISPLLGQPVCRMSSLQLLYSLYKYHEPFIKNGFRVLEIDCVYGLINPGQDLVSCEKEMRQFLKKKLPWAEVEIGTVPDPKYLITKIKDHSAYLYCGHGSGMQYLKGKDLKRALMKGLILLFGCSSNVPRNCGGRTPHQNNTYTYITNGCPCIIGCMQDVGSTDADAACQNMLSKFMPSIEYEGTKATVASPEEPNVLRALAEAKGVCSKYWSKSAFVARGIPCKTTVGDVAKILENLSR